VDTPAVRENTAACGTRPRCPLLTNELWPATPLPVTTAVWGGAAVEAVAVGEAAKQATPATGDARRTAVASPQALMWRPRPPTPRVVSPPVCRRGGGGRLGPRLGTAQQPVLAVGSRAKRNSTPAPLVGRLRRPTRCASGVDCRRPSPPPSPPRPPAAALLVPRRHSLAGLLGETCPGSRGRHPSGEKTGAPGMIEKREGDGSRETVEMARQASDAITTAPWRAMAGGAPQGQRTRGRGRQAGPSM